MKSAGLDFLGIDVSGSPVLHLVRPSGTVVAVALDEAQLIQVIKGAADALDRLRVRQVERARREQHR